MKRLFSVLVLIVALGSPAVSDEVAFSLEVGGDAVIACGIPVRAQVIFLDVSWVEHPWTQGFSSNVAASFEEGKGCAFLQPTSGVESNSVWAGVLTASGQTAFADGSQRPLTIQQLSSKTDLIWENRTIVGVKIPGKFVEMLVVRPGGGVWSSTAGDGGASDADQVVNGEITVTVECLVPELDTGGLPSFLIPGDVIIAIDVNSLVIFQLKVG